LIMCFYFHCFKYNWICFYSHCFRSNLFCIYVPTILGPIECVAPSTVFARVQLVQFIALPKIECTWFVRIWVCGELLVSFLLCWCKVVELQNTLMWLCRVCNSMCNFCMNLNACLLESFCLLVCMPKKVWKCILHQLPKFNVNFAQVGVQGTSQFLWHQAWRDPNWWII
jgi:hypothetical protein